MKICLVSSSGGHYEQLVMLLPILKKYTGFIITEETEFKSNMKDTPTYFVKRMNRTEKRFWINFSLASTKLFFILLKERPQYIISTGANIAVPICLIGKILGAKIIYIESFAKVSTPNLTGRFMYRFADLFFVQWESMKSYYPKAHFLGGIY